MAGLKFGSVDDLGADSEAVEQLLTSDAPAGLPEQEFALDPEPGFDHIPWDQLTSESGAETKKPSKAPSAAVKKDIHGKTAWVLAMFAGTWSMRDPYCGGVALEETPAVAAALTDLFCDSPDVVEWFTKSGSFMRWMALLASVQPIVSAAWGHHVSHTVTAEEQEEPDWSAYGAAG